MELVRVATEEIVARGARTHLSAEQLRCELALMPESMLMRDGPSVPEDLAILKDTRWLGRALLTLDIRATNRSSRLRLYGHYNRHPASVRPSQFPMEAGISIEASLNS